MDKDYKLETTNGYDFYEMASMLQKSIRRGNFELAGFAANELKDKYRNYLWNRLLVISAEDCYGIITKEIIGLKLADDEVNKNKSKERKDSIFISKAIILLSMAKKNRDACYFACNLLHSDDLLDISEIPDLDIEKCKLDKIPEWVYDVHTLKGKINGKTINDMIIEEQNALEPKQLNFFDDDSWDYYLNNK